MTKNNLLNLPEDYALVLQQIKENGEDSFINLSESLNVSDSRLQHIIQALRSKGLIFITRTALEENLIRLSAKGRKISNYIWPEMKHMSSAYNVL